MNADLPPPPTKPDLETTPRGSWLAILLTMMAGFAFVVVFTFLTLGFVWPFVVGFAVFGIIGLQYLLWGWWFERIYRSGQALDDSDSITRNS
jgi:hypothetical protein